MLNYMDDTDKFLTPGSSPDIVSTANSSSGDSAQKAFNAEYDSFGVKSNLDIPLSQVSSGNNAGIKSVVGISTPQTTQNPISPSGDIQSSTSVGYNIGTGWWMGFDNGTPKFFIGKDSGNKMTWDGTSLSISGTLTAGSINIPDTTTAASFHTDSSGNSWWGATTLAAAPASITSAGLARFVGISSLNVKSSTCFENSGRFIVSDVGGTGANTFNTSGLNLITGATGTSYALTSWFVSQDVFKGSPTFSIVINMATLNAASGGGAAFFGLGLMGMNGSGSTLVGTSYCGFWIQKSTPVVNVYAVQNNGDGAAYTTSAILTTVVDNDVLDLIFKINASSSIDYYWRKNVTGGLSAKTTLSTRVPTGASNLTQLSITNVTSAFNFQMIAISASYER